MRDTAGSPSGVQSVDRALSILETLAEFGEELGVTELGRRLGVHKATASRLVSTLAEHGLVERSPNSDRYRLGLGLVRLATAATSGLELIREARPILVQLAEESRETANLAVLDGDSVVNIDQVTPPHQVVSVNWVGRRTPLHCTSSGKVLLAHLPEEDRARLLRGALQPRTPNTVVDRELLEAQLLEADVKGFAWTIEELEVGLNAVAAPVRDASGTVVAAVSVSGPAYRLTPRRIRDCGRLVRNAGADLSRRLGFVEERHTARARMAANR
jgi:DNA-binding IclR family transcriptional regulator